MMHSNPVHNWFLGFTVFVVVAAVIVAVISTRQRRQVQVATGDRRAAVRPCFRPS